MKRIPVLSTLALCGLVALPLAQDKKQDDHPPVQQKEKVYKLGSTVDESVKLTDLDGNQVTFKDLRGKVVLVHFWSMTCPYEIVATPKFVALEKRWKDQKDVVMLAVDSNATEIGAERPTGDGAYADIREYMKKHEFTFPVYADHGNVVADLFQAQHTPHCFVIDPQGKVVYAGGLDDDPRGVKGEEADQYVRDAVEETLAGKEVTVKESKPYGCSIKRVRS